MVRNLVGTASGKCGIAMLASYPIKKGKNPPNPGPSPPSPVKPPTVCNSYFSCPESNTCCCVYEYANYCLAWGCCPLDSATCCDDHYSCCPHDYPICDLNAGTCLIVRATQLLFVTCFFWVSDANFCWVLPLYSQIKISILLPFAYECSCLQQSKDNPLGVKALRRTPAKPHWAFGSDGKRSSV